MISQHTHQCEQNQKHYFKSFILRYFSWWQRLVDTVTRASRMKAFRKKPATSSICHLLWDLTAIVLTTWLFKFISDNGIRKWPWVSVQVTWRESTGMSQQEGAGPLRHESSLPEAFLGSRQAPGHAFLTGSAVKLPLCGSLHFKEEQLRKGKKRTEHGKTALRFSPS